MPEITIERVSEDDAKTVFNVAIDEGGGETAHTVEVPAEYYKKLTGGRITAEDLVVRTFRFLLQREPKEMIMSSFDLPVVGRYFPEYESLIMEE
jgi:hypothetical protein